MNAEQARDRFSEAYEGDLDEAARSEFDALLEGDEELRAEYEDFVETMEFVGKLDEDDDEPVPNLLPRLQERLHKQTKGRMYRDKFAKRAMPSLWAPLIAMFFFLALAVAVLYMFDMGLGEEPEPEDGQSTPEQVVE